MKEYVVVRSLGEVFYTNAIQDVFCSNGSAAPFVVCPIAIFESGGKFHRVKQLRLTRYISFTPVTIDQKILEELNRFEADIRSEINKSIIESGSKVDISKLPLPGPKGRR